MIKWNFGNSRVQLDLTVLENLKEKIRKTNAARAEVGLFKDTSGRKSSRGNLTNPQLGAIHEFGTETIPARSFLRYPLMTRLFPAVRNTDWIGLIMSKGVPTALGLLGLKAEQVIHQGFATGGWGWWKRLAARTIRRKGHAKILIETGQMENAVSSRVVIP